MSTQKKRSEYQALSGKSLMPEAPLSRKDNFLPGIIPLIWRGAGGEGINTPDKTTAHSEPQKYILDA